MRTLTIELRLQTVGVGERLRAHPVTPCMRRNEQRRQDERMQQHVTHAMQTRDAFERFHTFSLVRPAIMNASTYRPGTPS